MKPVLKLLIFKNVILPVGSILFLSGIFFSSCYYDSVEGLYGLDNCDTVDVSYSADILPILQLSCYSCHDDVHAIGDGSENFLEGYEQLMEFVEPNDPENSLFYTSIVWIPGTAFMPRPPGSQQLNACDIAIVKSWIDNGALNN
ncbi:MAG: hypothetical protein ACHQFW_01915 [Chitinophagales bacterium]